MTDGDPRTVADRLLDLAETGATGVLTLARGQVKKRLYLREGVLVAAESDLREDALGEVLVALGMIGKSRLPQLLAETRRRGQKMGAVVVDLGWMTPDAVLAALGEQVRRRARGCLRWLVTEAHFDASAAFVGSVIEYPTSLAPLVFAGLRETASFELLLPALDAGPARLVVLRRRFEHHRAEFEAAFGPLLLEQIAAGSAVADLAMHADAAVLIEALEVLLASGLGALVTPDEIPKTPAPIAITARPPLPERAGPPIDRLGAELAFQEGRSARLAGRPGAAIAPLRRAVELRPDQAAYHAWLGATLFEVEGRAALPEAIDRLEHAVALDPDAAEAHRLHAEVLLALGEGTRARAAFERTLTLRPDEIEAALALGRLLLGVGEASESERLYRRTLAALAERAPAARARLWHELAGLYAGALGDPEAAARAGAVAAELAATGVAEG